MSLAHSSKLLLGHIRCTVAESLRLFVQEIRRLVKHKSIGIHISILAILFEDVLGESLRVLAGEVRFAGTVISGNILDFAAFNDEVTPVLDEYLRKRGTCFSALTTFL